MTNSYPEIATYDPDTKKITAKRAGTTTFYVRSVDPDYMSPTFCEVMVVSEINYSVKLRTKGKGRIEIDGYDATMLESVAEGTELSVTAHPAYGYELEGILVNGNPLVNNKFTVHKSTVVTALFKQQIVAIPPFDIITKVGGGEGTVTVNGQQRLTDVVYGSRVTMEAKPANASWTLQSLTVSCDHRAAKRVYTVLGIFQRTRFSVTTRGGDAMGGLVAIKGFDDLSQVPYGTPLEVSVTPTRGYKVKWITINGRALEGRTFVVREATEVGVSYEMDTPDGIGGGAEHNGAGTSASRTLGGGCPDRQEVSQSVVETALGSLSVSPNPFTWQLRIGNPSGLVGRYELIHQMGGIVRSGGLNGCDIFLETSSLPSGLYIVRFYGTNSSERSEKVIKY